MLEISIHDNDQIAGGMRKTGIHGCFFSKVSGKGNITDVVMGGRQLFHLSERGIAASIINQYISKRIACHGGNDAVRHLVKGFEYFFLVIAGHNNINGFHIKASFLNRFFRRDRRLLCHQFLNRH